MGRCRGCVPVCVDVFLSSECLYGPLSLWGGGWVSGWLGMYEMRGWVGITLLDPNPPFVCLECPLSVSSATREAIKEGGMLNGLVPAGAANHCLACRSSQNARRSRSLNPHRCCQLAWTAPLCEARRWGIHLCKYFQFFRT